MRKFSKKVLGTVLSASMLISAFPGVASAAIKTQSDTDFLYFEDFNDGAGTDFSTSGGKLAYVDTGDINHKIALQPQYNDNDSSTIGTSVGKYVYLKASSNSSIASTAKLLVSFDIMKKGDYSTDNTTDSSRVMFRSNKEESGTSDTTFMISSNGTISTRKTFNQFLVKDTWYSVDVLIDYTNDTATYYINGTQYGDTFDLPAKCSGIQNIYISGKNHDMYFDNLRLSNAEALSTFDVSNIEYLDGKVKVDFTESVSSAVDTSAVDVIKTETKESVKSAAPVLQGKTLLIPVSSIGRDEEYAVVFPEGTVSILGKALLNNTVYFSDNSTAIPEADRTTRLIADFEDDDVVEKKKQFTTVPDYAKVIETGESGKGKVLQAVSTTDAGYNTRWDVGFKSTDSKIVLSYDVKVVKVGENIGSSADRLSIYSRSCAIVYNEETGVGTADGAYTGTYKDTYTAINNVNYIYQPAKYDDTKISLKDGAWNHVVVSYDYENDVVERYVNGVKMAEVTSETLEPGQYFYQLYINVKKANGAEYHFDNIEIGPTYQADSIRAVRLGNGTDVYGLLDTVPTSVNSITLTPAAALVADSVTNTSVTLKNGEESVSANATLDDDGNIVLSNVALSAGTQYTLSVSGVNTEEGNAVTYSTTFTTEAAKQLEPTKVVMTNTDGDEISNISAIQEANQGDIFVTGTIANAENAQKTVYVITVTYVNDRVENVNMTPVTVGANTAKELTWEDDIQVNIPEQTEGEYKVKAFIWSGDGNNVPLCEACVIDK